MTESSKELPRTFRWKAPPTNAQEFEALAMALDRELMERSVPPPWRPIMVSTLLWEAFRWEGRMTPDKTLADSPHYSGDALLAKLQKWYSQVYEKELHTDGSIAWVPYQLANHIWKVRLPIVFGRCRFFMDADLKNQGVNGFVRGTLPTLNIVSCIQGLTPGVVQRVTHNEWTEYWNFYMRCFNAMNWRKAVTTNILLAEGSTDFDAAVDELIARRFAQSRWSSAQAAEKTLKGCLSQAGVAFATSGPDGHNLINLASKAHSSFDLDIPEVILRAAQCSPKVRYGEEPSTQSQALMATHAVLEIFVALGRSAKLSELLKVERMDTKIQGT